MSCIDIGNDLAGALQCELTCFLPSSWVQFNQVYSSRGVGCVLDLCQCDDYYVRVLGDDVSLGPATKRLDMVLLSAASVVHRSSCSQLDSYWSMSDDVLARIYRGIIAANMLPQRRPDVNSAGTGLVVTGCSLGFTWNRQKGVVMAQHPDLDYVATLIFANITSVAPHFKFTSLYMNDGLHSKIHADKANICPSLVISLGPFVGGLVWQYSEDGGMMMPP